jgi:glycosyltransferase involved in cell wall biosynthesis
MDIKDIRNGNDPLVTVLMPVYNAAEFLSDAIESILNQTLTNFEFLIIDDGSNDASVSIIKSYNDKRIRLVRNETNLGLPATLNKGIKIADCELIARMDADDISYPDRLQMQYNYMKNNPDCALLSAWAREIDEKGETIYLEKWPDFTYNYNLNFECVIYHPTVMYRRNAVLNAGGYSIPYCEDYDLWWRIARLYKIHNLSEILLDYRSTNQSISRVTRKTEYELAQQQLVKRNIKYFTGQKYQLSDSEIEMFRYYFEPILSEKNKLKAIKICLDKLDYITKCILQKEDVNRNITEIQKTAAIKKEWTIKSFEKHLSKLEFFYLLISTKSWTLLKNFGIAIVRGNFLKK